MQLKSKGFGFLENPSPEFVDFLNSLPAGSTGETAGGWRKYLLTLKGGRETLDAFTIASVLAGAYFKPGKFRKFVTLNQLKGLYQPSVSGGIKGVQKPSGDGGC